MFRLIFLVALLAQASANKATTKKPKATAKPANKCTDDEAPFLETVCTKAAAIEWKQIPATCAKTCGLQASKSANTVACYQGAAKLADAKCTKTKPAALKTDCAGTAACGTWKETKGTCPAGKCGLKASQVANTQTCQVGGKDVAEDKCENKPTTKKDCAKTTACTWAQIPSKACPKKACGQTETLVANTITCVGDDKTTAVAEDKCTAGAKPNTATKTTCPSTADCKWVQIPKTACPKAACGQTETKVANVPTCVGLDEKTALADVKKCKKAKPAATETTCPKQNVCKWKQFPKTACPTACGSKASTVATEAKCVGLDLKTPLTDQKRCTSTKPDDKTHTCAEIAACGTWKETEGTCPAVKCGLTASKVANTQTCQVGGNNVADTKCENKPTTKKDCAKTAACGTWKETKGTCPAVKCGLTASQVANTQTCQVSGADVADAKCENKPTTKKDCAKTAACGTWKKTKGTCPAVKCGLTASQVADTHKCQVGGKDVADDKCENKPTTKTECKATAACGTWKETKGTCPGKCGLTASKVANTQTCQVGGNNVADDKCKDKPTTKEDCAGTAACGTWKETKGTCPAVKCGLKASQVANTHKCQVGGKDVADDKCKDKPTTKTECKATAACAKKCDGFSSDNKCYACPEGYTCDGTGKVTKTKKTCANGEVKTQKCSKCPDKHTCDFKTGDAKTDGKSVKKEEKPPVKTKKLNNSNTLSVALPLCLTALIMFK